MNEDDVITIGKLRRPGTPAAAISYDPTHGIRLEGETIPPEPQRAAAYMRRRGGWLRLTPSARRIGDGPVREFIKAWRTA